MKKTTIYLDVDGVLNAIPADPRKEDLTGWDIWRSAWINGYLITWSIELVDALNAIAEREDAEIRWLTTWRHLAVNYIVPGLDLRGANWHVVEDGKAAHGHKKLSKSNDSWWKMDAFRDDLVAHNPKRIVWLDDDLHYYIPRAENYLDAFGILEDDRLFISPNTSLGLTRDHISAIMDFINN